MTVALLCPMPLTNMLYVTRGILPYITDVPESRAPAGTERKTAAVRRQQQMMIKTRDFFLAVISSARPCP
jgi:hypothetical protein